MPMITEEEYNEYRKWKETQEPEVSKEPAQEEFPTWSGISGIKLGAISIILVILSITIWLCWPALAGAVNQQPVPGYQPPSFQPSLVN